MNGERGMVSVFVSFLTLIFIVALWSTISAQLCETKAVRIALNKGEADWCFEFWLNRYQTLVTGTIAIGVAFVTALQWREARSHTASLRRSILLEKKAALTELSLAIYKVVEEIQILFDALAAALTRANYNHSAIVWNGPTTLRECRAKIAENLRTVSVSEIERKAILVITSLERFETLVDRHLRDGRIDFFIGDENEQSAQVERLKKALAEFREKASEVIEDIGAEEFDETSAPDRRRRGRTRHRAS